MSDPRGDPIARRAAELLRVESIDERAVERVLAALRADVKSNGAPDADVTSNGSAPIELPFRARRRFALSLGPALAAAAVIFAMGLGLGAYLLSPRVGGVAPRPVGQLPPDVEAVSQARLVEFVLVAPRAAHVSLVGEFNGWDATATPMRHTNRGDGTWSVSVPLGAGRHVYAFVVDDSTWVPDPQAPLAPERWYGERNSVVVVPAAGGPRS